MYKKIVILATRYWKREQFKQIEECNSFTKFPLDDVFFYNDYLLHWGFLLLICNVFFQFDN